MHKARIVAWNENRFFGFLQTEDGQRNVFLHGSHLPPGYIPRLGDSIECEIRQAAKGLQAYNVRLLMLAPEAEGGEQEA